MSLSLSGPFIACSTGRTCSDVTTQLKVVCGSRTVVVVRSVGDGWASGDQAAAHTHGLCLSGTARLLPEGP